MRKNRLSHENMKNDVLSGDEIDVTTRENQGDYEIDRQVGNVTEGLVKLPTEKYKI